jgi:aryl-alcohol dehydrogenase
LRRLEQLRGLRRLEQLRGFTLKPVMEGDSAPRIFIPPLMNLHKQGRFPFVLLIIFSHFEQNNDQDVDLGSV